MSVDDPVLTLSTLTVFVVRSGGAFGVVEVRWNASVSGIHCFHFEVTTGFASVALIWCSTNVIVTACPSVA